MAERIPATPSSVDALKVLKQFHPSRLILCLYLALLQISLAQALSESRPHYLIGAGTSPRPLIHSSLSMMHRPELYLAASYLRPTDTYLEYGMGGSTLNFAPLVARAYSIEHDCDWHAFMLSRIANSTADFSHLTTRCVGVAPWTGGWGTLSPFEHAQYAGPFREYVDTVASLGEVFDVVLVDGRARMACALRALEFLKDDGVLILHDFYTRTKQYGGVLEYYDEVARVLAYDNQDERYGPIGEPQGIVVLRKKHGVKKVGEKEILKKYAEVDWRYPFDQPLTTMRGVYDFFIGRTIDTSRWKRPRNAETMVDLVCWDVVKILAMFYAVRWWMVRKRRSANAEKNMWSANWWRKVGREPKTV